MELPSRRHQPLLAPASEPRSAGGFGGFGFGGFYGVNNYGLSCNLDTDLPVFAILLGAARKASL